MQSKRKESSQPEQTTDATIDTASANAANRLAMTDLLSPIEEQQHAGNRPPVAFQPTRPHQPISAQFPPRTRRIDSSSSETSQHSVQPQPHPPQRPISAAIASFDPISQSTGLNRQQSLSNPSNEHLYSAAPTVAAAQSNPTQQRPMPNNNLSELVKIALETSDMVSPSPSATLPPVPNRPDLTNLYSLSVDHWTCDHSSSRQIQLVIRQHPEQCRVSGSSGKDRKTIEPPPMLQLVLTDDQGIQMHNQVEHPLLFVKATLWEAEANRPVPILPTRKATDIGDALIGTTISSCFSLPDMNNQRALFFAFPDLSVRIEGTFRLHFSLIDVTTAYEQAHGMPRQPNPQGHDVRAQAISTPFTVYSARTYPGIRESSELTVWLAKQGIRLPIRKEGRNNPTGSSSAGLTGSKNSSDDEQQ